MLFGNTDFENELRRKAIENLKNGMPWLTVCMMTYDERRKVEGEQTGVPFISTRTLPLQSWLKPSEGKEWEKFRKDVLNIKYSSSMPTKRKILSNMQANDAKKPRVNIEQALVEKEKSDGESSSIQNTPNNRQTVFNEAALQDLFNSIDTHYAYTRLQTSEPEKDWFSCTRSVDERIRDARIKIGKSGEEVYKLHVYGSQQHQRAEEFKRRLAYVKKKKVLIDQANVRSQEGDFEEIELD